jgi:hypothetical protein
MEIEMAKNAHSTPAPEALDYDAALSPEACYAAFEASDWPVWTLEDCPVPSNSDCNDMMSDMLPTLRLAWVTITKTKPELLEIVSSLESEAGGVERLLEHMNRAADWLQNYVEMLEAADVRLTLAAGARIVSSRAKAN